ncbi:MAG: AmpG family muropeptide MFS transporter [Alphaproteobacteria bacterium]|nr:AmpG family muropeptide MFS transporter [Alphaproteobacteria bacterium]
MKLLKAILIHIWDWIMSLKIYADKRMFVMLLLGFVSGLPFLLVGSTLSLWLKDAGISLAAIGLFSMVKAPYSFKWLLSPLIDQYKLPLFSKLGRRRGWAVFIQLLLMSVLVVMSVTNPATTPLLFVIWAFCVALFSASQDIVLDAYRIERFNENEQAAGVAVFVFGYRIGTLFAGAGALIIADYWSWTKVYQIMAIGVFVGMATILFAREPKGNRPSTPRTLRAVVVNAVIKPFTDFMKRDKWIWILLFVFFYRMSDAYIAPMSYPFFDDIGFTKMQIAYIIKIYGVIATIFGTFIGGIVVKRLGLAKSLLFCGLLHGASNLLYVYQVYAGNDTTVLAWTIFVENISGGMGTAAFVAYLSSLCNKKYTATQYALLSSFMGAARDLFAASSGYAAAYFSSWVSFFLVAASLTVPGLVILLYLMHKKAI